MIKNRWVEELIEQQNQIREKVHNLLKSLGKNKKPVMRTIKRSLRENLIVINFWYEVFL
jgi:hypothetical protein